MMEAVLFIGHGSRSAQGNEYFAHFIHSVLDQIDVPIKGYGYIEKATPNISEGIKKCVEQGGSTITIIPALLLPGVHANEDIPNEIEKAKRNFPNITFYYGYPIGVDQIIVDILQTRLEAKQFQDKENNAVLLIGHGSRDSSAQVEFEKLASLLQNQIKATVHTSYLKASPSYQEKHEQLSQRYEKIYVISHLLFSGGFQTSIAAYLSQKEHKEVTLCDPLGFDDQLKHLLMKRVKEAKLSPMKVLE